MASRKRRRPKRVSLVGEEPRTSPTPETARKLKADPLWRMAPDLSSEGLQAAHEIREAVNLIAAPLRVRVQKWERQDRSYSEHESERSVRLQQRYNSWVDMMTAKKMPVGPSLDVIIEGLSSREIESHRKWRHGSFRPYFLDAMDLYCALAGWKRPDK